MQRTATTIILALAWCFFSLAPRGTVQQPSAAIRLELSIANPLLRDRNIMVVILKIERHKTCTFPMEQWGLPGLSQYFNSLHEKAMETLCKHLHMA
jgi:hypothetical protein